MSLKSERLSKLQNTVSKRMFNKITYIFICLEQMRLLKNILQIWIKEYFLFTNTCMIICNIEVCLIFERKILSESKEALYVSQIKCIYVSMLSVASEWTQAFTNITEYTI